MPNVLCTVFGRSVQLCLKHKNIQLPLLDQLRWRKVPRRKPIWLPTAPSKVFKVPVHPYVPPEERKVMEELHDELYMKMDSLSKLFEEIVAQKSDESSEAVERAKLEEYKHQRLVEINRRENEKVRLIREAAREKRVQDEINRYRSMYEKYQKEQEEKKKIVDEIVRKAKETYANCLTYDTLDEAIEHALDNEFNMNFTIDLLGNVTWEGVPPKDYEQKVKKQLWG